MASARRRAFILATFGALAAFVVAPVQAAAEKLSKAEWQAIQRVISDQLAALKAGQEEKAFSYATQRIQTQFGDARAFMAMVRESYSPLLDARYTEFLEGAVIDGTVVQPLRLIGRDNTVLVALYTMEKQKRGGWRISGCAIAPSTVQAA